MARAHFTLLCGAAVAVALLGVGCDETPPSDTSCPDGTTLDFRNGNCRAPTTARDDRVMTVDALLGRLDSGEMTVFDVSFLGSDVAVPNAVSQDTVRTFLADLDDPAVERIGLYLPTVANGLRSPVSLVPPATPDDVVSRALDELRLRHGDEPSLSTQLSDPHALTSAFVTDIRITTTPADMQRVYRERHAHVNMIRVVDGP